MFPQSKDGTCNSMDRSHQSPLYDTTPHENFVFSKDDNANFSPLPDSRPTSYKLDITLAYRSIYILTFVNVFSLY